jgi:hypothetical protein
VKPKWNQRFKFTFDYRPTDEIIFEVRAQHLKSTAHRDLSDILVLLHYPRFQATSSCIQCAATLNGPRVPVHAGHLGQVCACTSLGTSWVLWRARRQQATPCLRCAQIRHEKKEKNKHEDPTRDEFIGEAATNLLEVSTIAATCHTVHADAPAHALPSLLR